MIEASLEQILDCAYGRGAAPAQPGPADAAMMKHDFAEAARLYATEPETPSIRAKRGFCLAMLGEDQEAETLLTLDNVGEHPLSRAILAWIIAGRHGQNLRAGFASKKKMEERTQRREVVEHLLQIATSASSPPALVFQAAFEILGTHGEHAEALASRARSLYPGWGFAHAIYARQQRARGTFDQNVLESLTRAVSGGSQHADVYSEAYAHALALGRFDDAENVIDALQALVLADQQTDDANASAIAEMRAMVSLHRGRSGDRGAYENIPTQLSPLVPSTRDSADGRYILSASKFLLQAALETGNESGLADSASALVEQYWKRGWLEELCSWSVSIRTPALEGLMHVGHLDFAFPKAWRRVADSLTGQVRERWCLLLAADAADNSEPDAEQVRLLRTANAFTEPVWLARPMYDAFANYEPVDFPGAGAALAQWGERCGERTDDLDTAVHEDLVGLGVETYEANEIVSMFEGALAWLQAKPMATGQVLLDVWGDCVIENGGKSVLSRIAALSLSRADSTIAREALQKALASTKEPRTELEEVLAGHPDPSTSQNSPEDLSLLEAAALIALLRASPLDHARWTLGPLRDAGAQRFEPTRKFIGVMFDLMDKGVIAVDASTPAGVLEVKDGRLHAYLDRVVWRISAHTLELHRAIRDLPRKHWPTAWRSHAPVLARDLGVEELSAYLEHLLTDRSLPSPDMAEIREIFRVQLEQLAVAQCYYLAHKTIKEALDYQARHRPGIKQLQSRVINLLRGNGEKAVAQGWDTRYERAYDLPASLLFEALHDVLTGWGQRAFDEPLMTLPLS